MPVEEFTKIAKEFGLEGITCTNVMQAYDMARAEASDGDTIFIGGSTFVVADLLTNAPCLPSLNT
jgi:dihydrofolate synthase/folylpolyglutamate synthase